MRHSRLEDVRRALEQTEVFGSLPERDLRELIAHGMTTCCCARETIFQKGDPGPSMMVVLAGRVKISNYTPDGKEAILDFLGPDQVFGEIAVLDGRPRSADATCMEPTELFVLRRRDILRLLEAQPHLGLRLIEVLCAKLRQTTRMVEDDRLLEPPARIARALLHLADEFGRRCGGAIRLQIRLRQRELGCYVGLSRELTNRQLGIWRHQGFIRDDDGCITILEETRLRQIAHP